MKVSLPALSTNATAATISPALNGAIIGQSRRKVCHVEIFIVLHSINQLVLK